MSMEEITDDEAAIILHKDGEMRIILPDGEEEGTVAHWPSILVVALADKVHKDAAWVVELIDDFDNKLEHWEKQKEMDV